MQATDSPGAIRLGPEDVYPLTDPHIPVSDESEPAGSPASRRSHRAPKSVTGTLTWLGGAEAGRADRHEGSAHEDSAYAVTGTVVLLFAVLAGVAVALAGAAAQWPAVLAAIAGVVSALLVGAVSRALATAPLSRHADERGHAERFGRIAVAVITGVVVAELASTVILGGSVDRTLDDRARRDVESTANVVTARTELDRVTAERGALTQAITQAQADTDQALIVARCEYHPTSQCPQTKITGVPGRGPETRTAESMLADARARLGTAQAGIRPLDERIAAGQTALDQARTAASRTSDRGLGAHWLAMNDYATEHPGALLLRLLTVVIAVVLALLPLLLRTWRGESSFDRAVAARAEVDRAARAADRLTLHADTAIDRELQRTRVIAAVGNLELGITEPQRRAVAEFEAPAALVSAEPAGLPAQRPEKGGGLDLPIIGTVPFTDTAARWIRPLIPGFVTTALDRTIDTATSPLRTVRQVFEEAEKITFTLERTRKVTVNSQDSHDPAAVRETADAQFLPPAAAQHPQYAYQHDPRYARYGAVPQYRTAAQPELRTANPQDALPAPGTPELGYSHRRALPPGTGR